MTQSRLEKFDKLLTAFRQYNAGAIEEMRNNLQHDDISRFIDCMDASIANIVEAHKLYCGTKEEQKAFHNLPIS